MSFVIFEKRPNLEYSGRGAAPAMMTPPLTSRMELTKTYCNSTGSEDIDLLGGIFRGTHDLLVHQRFPNESALQKKEHYTLKSLFTRFDRRALAKQRLDVSTLMMAFQIIRCNVLSSFVLALVLP